MKTIVKCVRKNSRDANSLIQIKCDERVKNSETYLLLITFDEKCRDIKKRCKDNREKCRNI